MNCETIANSISDIVAGSLSSTELEESRRHMAECVECAEALRGAEALALLKNRSVAGSPAAPLSEIAARIQSSSAPRQTNRRFWQGTGVGGAIAASLFAVALTFGWISLPVSDAPEVAEFVVSLNEMRNMDIAIETDRALQGATISIMLTGGIELDGYRNRRELTWTSDLSAGVNRLSLPVIAVGAEGGQMVVRLSHPESEQVFIVQLKTDV